MLKHSLRQNCISCVLGHLFEYGSFVGLPPVQITCDHKKTILQANISSSRVYLCFSLLFLIVLICSLISCGLNIINDIKNSKTIIEVLTRIPNFCIYLGCVAAMLLSRLQSSKIRRVCELLQDSLESFRESKLIILLTINDIINLRSQIYLQLLLLIGCIVGLLVMGWSYIEKFGFNTLELIGLLTALYTGLMMCFIIYHVNNVICILYKNCQYHLKTHLWRNLKFPYYNLNRRLTIVNFRFVKLQNVSEFIPSFTRLNSQLFVAIRLYNSFLNPFLLIIIIIFTLAQTAILLQYILRFMKNQPMFFNWTLVVLDVEIMCSLICYTYLIVIFWKLETLKYDMTSFFFKYPISRLFEEEKNQFESYIRALNHQEILTNGSDILTCKLSTMASISTGVLTLVSITMQFIIFKI